MTYTTENYEPNDLFKFRGTGFGEEAYAAIFVECGELPVGNKECGTEPQNECTPRCCFKVTEVEF